MSESARVPVKPHELLLRAARVMLVQARLCRALGLIDQAREKARLGLFAAKAAKRAAAAELMKTETGSERYH